MFKEEAQNDFVNVSYYMGTIIYSVINALNFCSDPCFPILKTQFIFFLYASTEMFSTKKNCLPSKILKHVSIAITRFQLQLHV
jgi:hypothetical protein